MTVLSDITIKEQLGPTVIYPFTPHQVKSIPTGEYSENRIKAISMGLSSAGYDVELSSSGLRKFVPQYTGIFGAIRKFANSILGADKVNDIVIDPKCPKSYIDTGCLVIPDIYSDKNGEFVVLEPGGFLLGVTKEYFKVPRDIIIECLGKSTYARVGVIVNVTPIEPGFEGNVVIEMSNTNRVPVRIYVNEGIAQFMLHRLDRPCSVSYGDRDGKYQGQNSVTYAKV